MKKSERKTPRKNSVSRSSAKPAVLQDKILAYCGYRLVGKKLVAAAYNPVPYQGL